MIAPAPFSLRSRRLVPRPVAVCALVLACAVSARAQRPATTSVHSLRDSILVSIVRTQIGTRYVLGGQSPRAGFDCSGLVRYAMAALRVALPRTSSQQAQVGVEIARDPARLRPGDLLTFGKETHGVSHIGIYIGHGRYVHASSVAGRVIESDLDRPASPLVRRWRGTRRVVAGAESDSTSKGEG